GLNHRIERLTGLKRRPHVVALFPTPIRHPPRGSALLVQMNDEISAARMPLQGRDLCHAPLRNGDQLPSLPPPPKANNLITRLHHRGGKHSLVMLASD